VDSVVDAIAEGLRGLKPLTDKDRREIVKNIDDKVLRGQPIHFRSSVVRLAGADARLTVEGNLTMAATTRSLATQLIVSDDGVAGRPP
jgi:hypothetical protein